MGDGGSSNDGSSSIGSRSSSSSSSGGVALPKQRGAQLDFDSLPHLFLSFGNAAYFELANNWAKSVEAIGAPYLIAGALQAGCAWA